eukprot:TRINITY_DN458_c0_g1_i1.p1 TRINITY_DN458_c0_g1~~TRINITY_DN458_c0_g1_i1.p1  ORF type:complete len:969 (+),score=273.61 TRINITY_DN458_c0_g1_i1:78-2909(+)
MNSSVTEDKLYEWTDGVSRVLKSVEDIFGHKLKNSKNVHSFWDYIINLPKTFAPATEDFTVVAGLSDVKTDLGKARAWLRLGLNNGTLSDYTRRLFSNRKLTNKYYEPLALALQQEESAIVVSLLQGLGGLQFSLSLNNNALDQIEDPTIARPVVTNEYPSRKKKKKRRGKRRVIRLGGDGGITDEAPSPTLPRNPKSFESSNSEQGIGEESGTDDNAGQKPGNESNMSPVPESEMEQRQREEQESLQLKLKAESDALLEKQREQEQELALQQQKEKEQVAAKEAAALKLANEQRAKKEQEEQQRKQEEEQKKRQEEEQKQIRQEKEQKRKHEEQRKADEAAARKKEEEQYAAKKKEELIQIEKQQQKEERKVATAASMTGLEGDAEKRPVIKNEDEEAVPPVDRRSEIIALEERLKLLEEKLDINDSDSDLSDALEDDGEELNEELLVKRIAMMELEYSDDSSDDDVDLYVKQMQAESLAKKEEHAQSTAPISPYEQKPEDNNKQEIKGVQKGEVTEQSEGGKERTQKEPKEQNEGEKEGTKKEPIEQNDSENERIQKKLTEQHEKEGTEQSQAKIVKQSPETTNDETEEEEKEDFVVYGMREDGNCLFEACFQDNTSQSEEDTDSEVEFRNDFTAGASLKAERDAIATMGFIPVSDPDPAKITQASDHEAVRVNIGHTIPSPLSKSAEILPGFVKIDYPIEDSWTPPKKQLFFVKHKKLSPKEQANRCAYCGAVFQQRLFTTRARYCHYTGQFYCTNCHQNDTYVIPANVIFDWDFTPRKVSVFAKEFLTEIRKQPSFNLKVLNPKLYANVPDLVKIHALRAQICVMKDFILTCREKESLMKPLIASGRNYLIFDVDTYSLSDLVDVGRGVTLEFVRKLARFFLTHILKCELCKAKGSICEFCRDGKTIYPFQLKSTVHCHDCDALHHRYFLFDCIFHTSY